MRPLDLLACALVVVAALVASGTDLPDPDIWWNTATGLFHLDHGAAPPVSYFGAHGCDEANDIVNILPQLALAWAWRALGMWGLVAVRAALVVVIGLAVAFSARDRLTGALVAVAAVGALSARASPRPELFATALLALVGLWATRRSSAAPPSPARSTAAMPGARPAARTPPARASRTFEAATASTVSTHGTSPGSRTAPEVRPRKYEAATVVHAVVGVALGAVLAWSHPLAFFAPFIPLLLAVDAKLGGRSARGHLVDAGVMFLGVCTQPAMLLAPVDGIHESAIAKALMFREYLPLTRFLDEGYRQPWLAALALLALVAVSSRTHRVILGLCAIVGVAAVFAAVRGAVVLPVLAPIIAARATPRLPRVFGVAVFVAMILVAAERAGDPIVHGIGPPDLAPTRITPLGPAKFLEDVAGDARPLVFAPLHAGNWLLIAAPRVRPVWTGKRTYSLRCGEELLAAQVDAHAFDDVDGRLHPDFVLLEVGAQAPLADALVQRGYELAYVDVVWAVFARPGWTLPPLVADAEHVAGAFNRPVDAPSMAVRLRLVCALLRRAAPQSAGDVCDAVVRMDPGGLTASSTER